MGKNIDFYILELMSALITVSMHLIKNDEPIAMQST